MKCLNSFIDIYYNIFDKYNNYENKSFATGDELIKELNLYPESAVLIEEASKALKEKGSPKLQVSIEQTFSQFKAENQGNLIRVRPDLSPAKKLGSVLFELTNVIQAKKFSKIWDKMVRGEYKNAADFVIEAELIEYQGIARCLEISKKIHHQKGQELGTYLKIGFENRPIEKGFVHYYTHWLSSKHKNYYRRLWEKYNIPSELTLEQKKKNRSIFRNIKDLKHTFKILFAATQKISRCVQNRFLELRKGFLIGFNHFCCKIELS